jgi:methionine-rich copper-binding protein CopC
MSANSSYTFRPGTLGYEWDTVEDNGFQPPGVAQLSKTTVAMDGNYVLQNYGDVYAPGTKTHALTLYRYQPSGALIFGAGTVQWAWGLEDEHLFQTATPTSDIRMQQATVNLLADMDTQPYQLVTPGLTQATKSTDTAAPVVTIGTTPSPTVALPYTFSGTVADGTGKVSGVEVSVDGTSWHPSNWQAGSGTWSYTYTPGKSGAVTVKVRAVDDSANLSAPVTRDVTVNTRPCPCSIWTDSTTPATAAASDSSALELGVKFQAASNGYVRGVKFYKGAGNTGTHTGSLWKQDGTLLAKGTFTGETVNGWQTLSFPTAVLVTANTTYIASYHTDTGHYAADSGYFTNSSSGLEPLTAAKSITADPNGVYKVGASAFPDRSYGDTNYWVDVVFGSDPGPDTRAPQIASTSPSTGQGSVALTAAPAVTFDEPIAPSSLQLTVSNSAGTVAGTTSLSSNGLTATFTPSAPLASGTTYTMSVRASDTAGNALPSAPVTWTFTTGTPRPATCPCTIWDDFATPAVATNPDSAVELGTKVRFDSSGQVLGVRFYKGAGNTGTHTGTLWSSTGTKLATGTFTGESANGWQKLTFATPLAVSSGQTYVVSYYAPNGGYSATNGYFANGGADFGALHALQTGVDGGNGVYRYGAGGGFPTGTYNAGNYWVDVIWQSGANGDSTPPAVTATTPVAGGVNVSATAPVTMTFSEAIDLATAQFSLADSGGAKVTGTLTQSLDKKTVFWTPAARLSAGMGYTASIKIADINGNQMPTPTTWSFTATTTQTCPCTLFSAASVPTVTSTNDSGNYELGVRFATATNGTVSGVTFYKGAGNTGTHTGSLWTSTGALLATGTFTGETASGWQTLVFATPVAVTAGQTYVASYTATAGHYSSDNGYFQRTAATSSPLTAPATGPGSPNGVYKVGPGFPNATYQGGNYWVDAIFNG